MAVELLAGQRQSDESSRAAQACNDYLRMGPGRSLAALAARYVEEAPSAPKRLNELERAAAAIAKVFGSTESIRKRPPTTSLGTLKTWSSEYGWQVRAEEYDAGVEEIKNQRRREAMEEGLALDYERVLRLRRMAEFLEGEIYETGSDANGNEVHHNVWLPDVKSVGFERVDIERFNGDILEQFRRTLDDIAKETGGRKKKVELTGEDGGPVYHKVVFEQLPARATAASEPGDGAE